jgi:hypothetical protein
MPYTRACKRQRHSYTSQQSFDSDYIPESESESTFASSTTLPRPLIPTPKPSLRTLFGSSSSSSSSSGEEDSVQLIQVVQHPSTSTVPPSVTVPASAAPALQPASSEQHITVSSLEQSQLIQSLNNFQEIILNRLDQLEQSIIHIQEQLNYLSETVEEFEHDYQS